jgi:hypothetical protein
LPGRPIKINGLKVAGFIGQERVNPDHELAFGAVFPLATQVIMDDRRGERQKLPVSAGAALGAALVT